MKKILLNIMIMSSLLVLSGCGSQPMSWADVKRVNTLDKSRTETPRNEKGQIHGIVKKYYKTGALLSTTTYVNGKKHGTEKTYVPMYTNEDYTWDIIANNKPTTDKKWETYLYSEVNYIDGQKVGIEKNYWKDYDLKAKKRVFYVSRTIPYQNGRKHGLQRAYNDDGTELKNSQVIWKNGRNITKELEGSKLSKKYRAMDRELETCRENYLKAFRASDGKKIRYYKRVCESIENRMASFSAYAYQLGH